MTREQSKQALQKVGGKLSRGTVDCATVCELLTDVESLEEAERQSALAEAATLICIDSLRSMSSLYSDFEDSLWQHFSKIGNLSSLIMDSLEDFVERGKYATEQYYSFLRGMFARSTKTRQAFYYEMLIEAGIEIEFNGIDFGASAAAFKRKAGASMHMEHLLVFYSVELFLKAYVYLHPNDSPLADEKIEVIYRHFEAAIPLIGKFERYTKDDGLFKFSASRRMPPLIK